ncbi:MAG TPA: M56 family metallopeptidase, partial [Longimicrobium sp.]|nr:M56 family metallopeptidase [Longimicrobium sp.]
MTVPFTLSPQAAFVAGMVVKATLLLAAAGLATLALGRRAPAAARHLVWTLAVCGLLALPLLSIATPGWRLPFVTVRTGMAEGSGTPRVVDEAGTPTVVYAPAAPAAMGEAAPATPAVAPAAPVTVTVHAAVAGPHVTRAELAGTGGGWTGFAKILALVYAAVTLALLARIVIGRTGVRRLAREAEVVTDPEWSGMVRDLAWTLDINRPVTLLRSTGATMPMTWGIVRPVVLLPAESAAWTTEHARVVLLHELAHVARHDCLTQTLAAIACALYWFHPGSWHAARRLRVERELACDDRVLAAGTRAREYAAHLLEVARAFRAPPLAAAAAVSMARPSQLEGRLLAVLDGVRDRRTVSRPAAALAAIAAAALILPLAAMRPGEARAAGRPSQTPAVAPRAFTKAGGGCQVTRGTSFNCTVQARSGER